MHEPPGSLIVTAAGSTRRANCRIGIYPHLIVVQRLRELCCGCGIVADIDRRRACPERHSRTGYLSWQDLTCAKAAGRLCMPAVILKIRHAMGRVALARIDRALAKVHPDIKRGKR